MSSREQQDIFNDAWNRIYDIYENRALRAYGLSGVNQRDHALQAATLACEAGYPDPLVIAALLHDVGHMIHELGDHPAADGIDDRHEAIGAHWIGQYFGHDVAQPVRLHVDAKRYLCAVEPAYFGHLSRDSVESLRLQGGVMSPNEVSAFDALPFSHSAVLLRRLDEQAKRPGAAVMSLESFRSCVERLILG